MLIIVPPSETKRRPPESGPPLDLEALAFPELTPMRRRVLDALVTTSGSTDAFVRLHEKLSKAPEVARNTWLPEVPTLPAADVYSGPFHEGFDLAGLSPAARAHAGRVAVITSPLWGLLRPDDRIPPYRLSLFSRLHGLDGRTDAVWRTVLPEVLTEVAGRDGLIVELRSPESQSIGKPTGVGERIVAFRVEQRALGRRIGDVVAKRVRGQAAHELLASGLEPDEPSDLIDVLGERWPVRLESPKRTGNPWTLTISVDS